MAAPEQTSPSPKSASPACRAEREELTHPPQTSIASRQLSNGMRIAVRTNLKLEVTFPLTSNQFHDSGVQSAVSQGFSNVEALAALRLALPYLREGNLEICLRDRSRKLREDLGEDHPLISQRTAHLPRLMQNLGRALSRPEMSPLPALGVDLRLVSETGDTLHVFEPKASASEVAVQQALREIRNTIHARERLRGSDANPAELLRRTIRTAKIHSRVFRLAGLGYPSTAISRKLGIQDDTVRNWLKGDIPQRIERLSATRRPEKNAHLRRELELPRKKSVAWAALLGALAGDKSDGLTRASIRFAHRCEAVVEALDKAMRNLVPELEPTRGVREAKTGPMYFVRAYSTALTEALNGLTAFNGRVPWEALGTESERAAYLGFLMSFRGNVSQEKIKVRAQGKMRFLVEIGLVMDSMGIRANIWDGKIPTLAVADRESLGRMLADDLFLDPKMRTEVGKLVELKRTKGKHTQAEWIQAMAFHDQFPEASMEEIARATGIAVGTVRSWVKRGVRPESVQLKEKLEALRIEHNIPIHDVPSRLFRNTELPRDFACEIAADRTFEEACRAVKRLNKLGIRGAQASALPILRWSRFDELIDIFTERERKNALTLREAEHPTVRYANSLTGIHFETYSLACWGIVYHHLVDIRAVANRLTRGKGSKDLSIEDLTQVGCLGALEAMSRFDPEQTPDFFPWCLLSVRGAMLAAIQDFSPGSKLTMRMASRVRDGELPGTIEGIVAETGCTANTARAALSLLRSPTSLSTVDPESDEEFFLDPAAPRGQDPADEVATSEAFDSFLGPLSPSHRRVVQLYYREGMDFNEIAKTIGCNAKRARKLHAEAIELMRSRMVA